ncbi:PPE domain-containing protein [Streptomyces glaucosporus]|uniref:PPE domain-containing protein n=1 Tax=Streptomyces glaucosporus TaxID=284044 RepID=A0ABN3IFF1_9ACTN
MPNLTYSDLYSVSLSDLASAVTDWESMTTKLEKLADDARSGMAAKADKARWRGENAGVTKPFVRKTAKEFGDAAAQARSIRNILRDANSDLSSIQSELKKSVGEARGQGIKVTDNGDGTVKCVVERTPYGTDPDAEEHLRRLEEVGRGLERRINGLIARAEEVDDSAARALKRIHGGDTHNFGHAKYSSLDAAQAERALELAALGPEMTNGQYTELNTLLKFNARDAAFSTAFYKGLGGPEEALRFYGLMSHDGTRGDDKKRLSLARDLQRNMGIALATATDKHEKTHLPASWGREFRELGTKEIELEPGSLNRPYGYQVLGGLLRYGNYDADFLTPIAEHITQLHHEEPMRFMSNKPMGLGDPDYGFNPSGKGGAGYDPLTSVLEALGHSPEAAERFFTGTPTVYQEDGTVHPDKEVKLGYTYLDEFLREDFEWPPDTLAMPGMDEKVSDHGPDALGHALEAAATGRPYDSESTDAIKHTTERVKLTKKLVSHFGEHPELIRRNENGEAEDLKTGPLHALRDSLGNITAEYMADFQRTLYRGEPSSDLFPATGVPAIFGATGLVKQFLAEVGQDPDAYGAITNAQQAYTSVMVDNVINGKSESTVPTSERVRTAVAPGAMIAGIMSAARADATIDYHAASVKDYNEAAADNAKWAGRTVELATSFIPPRIPAASEAINWLAEDITEGVVKNAEKDVTTEVEKDGKAIRDYSNSRDATIDAAAEAVKRAVLGRSDINDETIQDLQESARTQAGNSHGEGSQWYSAGDAS